MVREHDRYDRIGEFHAVQNLGTDDRVDLHFVELDRRQPARFRNDVLRNRQLADVVQQRGRLQRLEFRFGEPQLLGDFHCINPDSPKMMVGSEVFRFDGQRQSFNGSQVQARHVDNVAFLGFETFQILPVRPINPV